MLNPIHEAAILLMTLPPFVLPFVAMQWQTWQVEKMEHSGDGDLDQVVERGKIRC